MSALNYRGNPYRVLELARYQKIRSIVSDPILAETERILQERFSWPEYRAKQARDEIRRFSLYVSPSGFLDIIKEDPDDNRILECALAGRADYIVSGDKDLLRLSSVGSINIVNPADFLSVIEAPKRGGLDH